MRTWWVIWLALVGCTDSKDPVDDTDTLTDDTDPVDDTDPSDDTDPVDDTDPTPPGSTINPGELVITELFIESRDCEDGDAEYIEFRNKSGRQLDLAGLNIVISGQRFVINRPTLVAADAWVLATKSPINQRCWGDVGAVEYPNTLILGNGGGTVALRKEGTLIDAVEYQLGAVVAGRSLQLDPRRVSAAANDNPGNWCLSDDLIDPALLDKGSPGLTNHQCGEIDPVDSGIGETGDTDPGDTDTGGGGGGDDTGGGGGGDDTSIWGDDTGGGGGPDTQGGPDTGGGGGPDTQGGPDTGGGGGPDTEGDDTFELPDTGPADTFEDGTDTGDTDVTGDTGGPGDTGDPNDTGDTDAADTSPAP